MLAYEVKNGPSYLKALITFRIAARKDTLVAESLCVLTQRLKTFLFHMCLK